MLTVEYNCLVWWACQACVKVNCGLAVVVAGLGCVVRMWSVRRSCVLIWACQFW